MCIRDRIWIMDNQGNILFDSTDESVGKNAANATYKTLKGFNTSDFGNRYYMTGNFYGCLSSRVCVSSFSSDPCSVSSTDACLSLIHI